MDFKLLFYGGVGPWQWFVDGNDWLVINSWWLMVVDLRVDDGNEM